MLFCHSCFHECAHVLGLSDAGYDDIESSEGEDDF